MVKRPVYTGTGITRRKRVSFQAPLTAEDQEAIKAAFREMGRKLNLDSVLADIEAVAVAVLADAGLPNEYKLYEFPGGGCWGLKHLVVDRRGFAIDSAEGYAARAIDGIAYVKDARSQGDLDRTVLEAMTLVAMLSEADFKHKFEPAALTGIRVREGASRGGRPPPNDERNIAMAREFQATRATATNSDTALKASIGKRYGLRRTASIEAIDQGLKKLSV